MAKAENSTPGYLRLYRSTANKGWYKKSEYVHLWIHILIKANHSEKEFFFNGASVKVNPGEFITGRKQLQEETGIHESKIERILTYLEKIEHQIEQQKTTKNRVIRVLNWENYQNTKNTEQQIEQQLNNNCTTNEQQLNTTNKLKELKNKEELKKRKQLFSQSLQEFLPIYGSDLLNDFYSYWTEPNKSGTKFKKEMQATWDTARRLKIWSDNDFNKKNNGNKKSISNLGTNNNSNRSKADGLQL